VDRSGHGEPRAQLCSGGDGEAECFFTLGQEVVLVARGGGGDGGVAVAKMNRSVELCCWRAAIAELRW